MSEVHSSNSCSCAKFLFLQACDRNDLDQVRHSLGLGANVNWMGPNVISGLHVAACHNYMELLELLLSQPGVDVNITNKNKWTPLMFACYHGHENIVRRLCQVNGIDPNLKDVCPNLKDDCCGLTALHHAVFNNRPRCVEILKTLPNVDWNVRTNRGVYPLEMAVKKGYADVLQILRSVRHLDISKVKSLFLRACDRNDLEKVRHCLDIGANVNWKGNDLLERSGLHLAANNNYEELLELLLSQPGVDVNITDKYNNTPLFVAWRHENIVRRLCQVNGIDPNIRARGYTALHFAAFNNKPGSIEILRTLPNVDWNVRTNRGVYPLTVAVMRGYADFLQTLLSVPHLDLSVTDGRGRTVAQIAVEEEEGERQRCVEILSRERRVDWNIKNSDGDTPVMFCLKTNKIEKARCLINTPGVDLDTVDRDGKYLETIARDNNLTDMLDLLFTFTGPRLMILKRDSLLSRQSGTISSLQSLSRDVVLTILITNNSQERKVESLVDRLGELELTRKARETLLGVKKNP